MSTTAQPLKYLWYGYFSDGHLIVQPEDDRYSKHDDKAEYNPSAFRDLLEYMENATLVRFELTDSDTGLLSFGVDLSKGIFYIDGMEFSIEEQNNPLSGRKIAYWREVDRDATMHPDGALEWHEAKVKAYYFGYEGKNANDKLETKVIRVE